MTVPVLALALAAGLVAFTNGANANFKGVASLYGSGTATRRRALVWGTAATFAGSVAAAFLAGGLLAKFSGRGIVPDDLARSPAFAAAAAVGAGLTSLLATRLGFPVSTTHALVGGLVGAGLAGGAGVNAAAVGTNFVYPLVFSPAVAAVLGGGLYLALRPAGLAPDHRTPALDGPHYLSAGAASFARGLNDTPKMAALLLAAPAVDVRWGFLAVATLIALGGLLAADRVAETLGKRVTAMTPGQGFAASLATAALVATASLHGLPVSTTHVSVGALIGIGVVTGQAHGRKAAEILLAWVTTVPCAAALAAAAYGVLAGR